MVIWPANLDKTRSRKEGRIIPKRLSVPNPKLEEMEMAAAELHLYAELEPDKSYPRSPLENSGRMLIDKAKKSDIAKKIAIIINKHRGMEK